MEQNYVTVTLCIYRLTNYKFLEGFQLIICCWLQKYCELS